MFTIEKIKEAHSKVKSGADFPNYIQDLIKLGVEQYDNYISDGHTIFYGKHGFKVESGSKYPSMSISYISNTLQFQKDLKEHQEGKTDYLTFCINSAKSGIKNWVVDLLKMTCTYYDNAGNIVLTENIPSLSKLQ